MRWSVTLGAIGSALFLGHMTMAQTIGGSLRPELRPDRHKASPAGSAPVIALAGTSVLRPQLRPGAAAEQSPPPVDASQADAGFQRWLPGMRARAVAQGISGSMFDRAVRGVRYDPEVIRRDLHQSEFTKTIWEYLDSAASDTRVENGKAALQKHRRTLEAIEARYGVE